MNWRFAGYYDDSTTTAGAGLYKVGLRYLDTYTNRWTQQDPKTRITNPTQPAEASPYCYAAANGCNQTDPTGAYSLSLTPEQAICDVIFLLVDIGLGAAIGAYNAGAGAIIVGGVELVGTAIATIPAWVPILVAAGIGVAGLAICNLSSD